MTEKRQRTRIDVRQSVTRSNDAEAENLRQILTAKGIWVVNLVSSPGAGKTTLIEKTLERLGDEKRAVVIEGDPYTSLDADRITALGATGIQINTRAGCHLDALMITRALDEVDLSETDLIIIENVGNLLCPAAWDLGQSHTVVLASPTEGGDKPLKYPDAFIRSDVLVINKTDLLPHLPPSSGGLAGNANTVNAALKIFETSCITGEGLDLWMNWVRARMAEARRGANRA
ncbi:MAG: hydrogenase nickel incorporation protein HypB [Desulfobacterales bacterium]|nr:hydrogenase nickel incorporation protein HypB [Desulfobacterales bacterium]